MKTIISKVVLIGILATSVLLGSCKKKGCTDSTATNYSQKAKKDDGSCIYSNPSVVYPPHTISGCSGSLLNISTNTTWDDVYTDSSLVDYVIGCRINVMSGAILTIKPGVRIQFSTAQSSISTISDGGIIANGSASQPIILEGTTSIKGLWSGIYIGAVNAQTSFNYVTFKDAGAGVSSSSAEEAGLFINASPSGSNLVGNVTNCKFINNKGTGFMSAYGAFVTNFGSNTFNNNENSPLRVDVFGLNFLNNDNTFLNSTIYSYIDVYKGHPTNGYTNSIVIKKLALPYRLANGEKLNIKDGDLIIQAGVIMQMSPGTEVDIVKISGMNARLFINGTASNPVVFIGTEDQVGLWKGIRITTTGSNTITYCDISHAGGATMVEPGQTISSSIFVSKFSLAYADLTNCSIEKSGGHGIAHGATGSVVTLTNNQFFNIAGSNVFTY